jgi:hypothetical protein
MIKNFGRVGYYRALPYPTKPWLILQPPLDDAQEVNAEATAMAITKITIVFLIFCGI